MIPRCLWIVAFIAMLLYGAVLPGARLAAQVQGVQLEVLPTDIGIEGHIQPGRWVPVRLRLTNQASTPRDVICRMIYPDRDGDTVSAQRRIVLNPADENNTQQIAWVYGHPQDRGRTALRFDVVDAATNTVLASVDQTPLVVRERATQAFGVCGPNAMGLDARLNQPALHEPFALQTNLSLTRLPDHWLGYDAFDTLIWTPRDTEPTDASVPPAVLSAIQAWVYRGGRFTIVLPTRNQTWTDLGAATGWPEALPVNSDQIQPGSAPLETLVRFLGAAKTTNPVTLSVNHFTPKGPEQTLPGTLVRGSDGRVYGVTQRHGFGAITLLGVDLTQPALTRLGLPESQGDWPFWNLLLGLRTPVFDADTNERYQRAGYQDPAGRLPVYGLGTVATSQTAITGRVAAGLTAAIILFALYFLVAGVLMDRVLRKKRLGQHGWVIFTGLCGSFTLVAWLGGWGFGQHRLTGRHLSIVDIDTTTDTARVHSWASVLVPEFGVVDFQAHDAEDTPLHDQHRAVIHNPAPPEAKGISGFLDPQTYALDLAQTDTAAIPVRATTKQIALHYTGSLNQPLAGLAEPVVPLRGTLLAQAPPPNALIGHTFAGQIKHALPAALQDVLLIYCPGTPTPQQDHTTTPDARQPWVWRLPAGRWAPGDALDLTVPASAMRLVQAPRTPGASKTVELPVLSQNTSPEERLAELEEAPEKRVEHVALTRWGQRTPNRNQSEGFLGSLVVQAAGQFDNLGLPAAISAEQPNPVHAEMLRLSFFDRLPPPVFRRIDQDVFDTPPFAYERWFGHRLDLSHLLNEPRFIVIGHLPNRSLPAPLTVDEQTIETDGHTVFRFILELPAATPGSG